MVRHGLNLVGVVRAASLIHNSTKGFCIDEQALAQTAASGDDRYSLSRREERLDRSTHTRWQWLGPRDLERSRAAV